MHMRSLPPWASFALYLILVGCGKRVLYPDKLGFPFALFAIALLVSLLFTQSRSDSIRILLFFIAAFIFTYVIAADISDEKRLVKLLAFIYAAVILTSLYAIIQRKFGLVYVSASFTDLKLNTGIPSRVTSTLDNPEQLLGISRSVSCRCALRLPERAKSS